MPALRSSPGSAYVFQPTTPTRLPGPMPSPPRIVGQRPRAIPWLARQAEVLEQLSAHRQRGGTGQPVALVADEDRGLAGRSDDEDGLLEAWVEPGQERQVGAVLAVGVDDQPVVAASLSPLAERLEPRARRSPPGSPASPRAGRSSGSADLGEARRRPSRSSSRRPLGHGDGGVHGRASVAPRVDARRTGRP